jgi:hypothetical protein
MLRADKSAVLIPQRLGRTNIDFVDEHGNLMGSMDVRVVRQSINDRVVIYDRPRSALFGVPLRAERLRALRGNSRQGGSADAGHSSGSHPDGRASVICEDSAR